MDHLKPLSEAADLQQLLQELQRERRLRQDLEASNAELLKGERLKQAFLTRICQELRPPLAVAIPALEFIAKAPSNPENRKFFEILRQGLTRMQETAEELLLFSDIQNKNFGLSRAPVDMRPVLEKVILKYKGLWESKDLSIRLEWPESIAPVQADSDLIELAFKHLFLNSVQSSQSGGKIAVSAWERKESLLIFFSDTSLSTIPSDRTFYGFHQVSEYLAWEVEGWGLGLVIVRRVIEAHGGKVFVKSMPQHGSNFIIILPR